MDCAHGFVFKFQVPTPTPNGARMIGTRRGESRNGFREHRRGIKQEAAEEAENGKDRIAKSSAASAASCSVRTEEEFNRSKRRKRRRKRRLSSFPSFASVKCSCQRAEPEFGAPSLLRRPLLQKG